MRLTIIIFILFFLVGEHVLAASSTKHRHDRKDLARHSHRSNPFCQSSSPVHGANIWQDSRSGSTASSSTKYSHNWAGVVRETPPPNSTYGQVSTIFTIPAISTSSSQGSYQAASVWVGIDGASRSPNVIFQAGIDLALIEGNHSYTAWYQWYPDDSIDLDLAVHAGDEIYISVSRLAGGKKGASLVENRSTGQRLSITSVAPVPTATLMGQSVEWIVEDYQVGGQSALVELVDFGEIHFRDCNVNASSKKRGQFGLQGATRYELVQGNKLVSDTNVVDQTSLRVKYEG